MADPGTPYDAFIDELRDTDDTERNALICARSSSREGVESLCTTISQPSLPVSVNASDEAPYRRRRTAPSGSNQAPASMAWSMLQNRAEGILAYTKNPIPDEQRPFHGQSLPLGDTGDGNTGVPSGEQGISNRPGDRPDGMSVQEDQNPDEGEEDEDEAVVDEEDLDDESDDDEEGDDEEDEDEDEQTDPGSEPGKPV
jgi:hypothetical protein